jgi:hypothetical protein
VVSPFEKALIYLTQCQRGSKGDYFKNPSLSPFRKGRGLTPPRFIFSHPPPFKEEEGLSPLLNTPLKLNGNDFVPLYTKGIQRGKAPFIYLSPSPNKITYE